MPRFREVVVQKVEMGESAISRFVRHFVYEFGVGLDAHIAEVFCVGEGFACHVVIVPQDGVRVKFARFQYINIRVSIGSRRSQRDDNRLIRPAHRHLPQLPRQQSRQRRVRASPLETYRSYPVVKYLTSRIIPKDNNNFEGSHNNYWHHYADKYLNPQE